jgi:hypothetical protein
MKYIIKELKERNPYPKSVFMPLNKREVERYVKILGTVDCPIDRIHAYWMRKGWDLCIRELEKI